MTQVAAQQQHQAPLGGNGTSQAVAIFQPPRLPYHDAIAERFGDMGVTKATWKALVEAVYPTAKRTDSVVMALQYCQARKLDPFKRPVHIVPMWDSRANDGQGGYIETVWPGISELRTTAFRTGEYAGCDRAVFGPMITRTFKGEKSQGRGKPKVPVEITLTFPEWCEITVYRRQQGHKEAFAGPRTEWIETYATIGKSELPNDMWRKRAKGQLEKCAEAAALRKAFPEEIGGQLTAEEMHSREAGEGLRDVTPERQSPPSAPARPGAALPAQDTAHDVEFEYVGGDTSAGTPKQIADELIKAFHDAGDQIELESIWNTRDNQIQALPDDEMKRVTKAYDDLFDSKPATPQ